MDKGLVLFSVKDYDLLGYNNQYVGEAFLHFKEIIDTNDDIESLPQIHLELGRPTNLSKWHIIKFKTIKIVLDILTYRHGFNKCFRIETG